MKVKALLCIVLGLWLKRKTSSITFVKDTGMELCNSSFDTLKFRHSNEYKNLIFKFKK